jgi:hypothetical protein
VGPMIVRMTLHSFLSGSQRVEEINIIFPLGEALRMNGLRPAGMMTEGDLEARHMGNTMTVTARWIRGTECDPME